MSMTEHGAVRRLLSTALLLTSGLIVALLVAEGALRVAGISFPVFDTYDDLRGVALRPGNEGWYQREGRAYLRINSAGYRDSEHEVAKPANTFRVAVLGDSFAEARQVAVEDTFWSHLGQHLGRCPASAGRTVEVLNFGVGGYGTTEELLTLRKDVLRYSPDLVLLAFFVGNDVRDNSRELTLSEGWRVPKPIYFRQDGKLVLDDSFRQSRGQQLLYEATHHSRLLQLVNEARRAWVTRQVQASAATATAVAGPPTVDEIYAPPPDRAWQEAWLVTEELLGQMHREVDAAGARFVVALVTTPEQVQPDPAVRYAFEQRLGVSDLFYADRRLTAVGQREGFQVITLAERLQRVATERHVFLHGFKNSVMGEGHWNEDGHREAAKVMVESLCGGPRSH